MKKFSFKRTLLLMAGAVVASSMFVACTEENDEPKPEPVDLTVSVDNLLVLNNSYAFDLKIGKDAASCYMASLPASQVENWTNNMFINYLIENTKDTKLDETDFSDPTNLTFSGLDADTEYVLFAVATSNTAEYGPLVTQKVQTLKASSSDPIVNIKNVSRTTTDFNYTTDPDGYTAKYYQIAYVGDYAVLCDYYGDAFVAYYLREGINDNSIKATARGEDWAVDNEETDELLVGTWGVDADGNFSNQVNVGYYEFDGNAMVPALKSEFKNKKEIKKALKADLKKNLKIYAF